MSPDLPVSPHHDQGHELASENVLIRHAGLLNKLSMATETLTFRLVELEEKTRRVESMLSSLASRLDQQLSTDCEALLEQPLHETHQRVQDLFELLSSSELRSGLVEDQMSDRLETNAPNPVPSPTTTSYSDVCMADEAPGDCELNTSLDQLVSSEPSDQTFLDESVAA